MPKSSVCFGVLLSALLLNACSPGPATRAVDIEAETQTILALSTEMFEAYQQHDAATYASFFDDDGRIIWGWPNDEMESYVGHAEIQQTLEEDWAVNPNEVFEETDRNYFVVAPSGDLAYQYGTYAVVNRGLDNTDVDYGHYMTTWRKVNGSWKVASDMAISTFNTQIEPAH